MSKDRNAFIAGTFILLSGALAVLVVFLIRGRSIGIFHTHVVSFRLTDDLGGLASGDDVRIGGVKVGNVSEVRLLNLDGKEPRVLVKFTVPGDTTLHEDTVLRVQSALTGPTNLNIEDLGTGNPLTEGTELSGYPDPKNAFLAGLPKVNETFAAFKQTANDASTLVKHVNDKIDPVVQRYDGVAQNAGQMLVQVRDLVGESKTDFRGTVKNLNEATASIKEKIPGLLDRVSGALEKIDSTVVSAKTALEDVQKTVANTRDASGTLRSVITGNRGKLESMVASLKATSDNLKATSIEVRRSPWRLLYKPTPDEMGNLNLYDSARQFAEGANNLSDAAVALRDALNDPQTDKAQLQKLVSRLDESFNGFQQVERKLWTAVKE